MKKFFIALVLSVALIIGVGAICANASSSGICGENVTWVLDDDGTLTISGTGAMRNYSSSRDTPWFADRTTIKNIVLEEGVTSIGEAAFWGCTSLESVIIPDSVISIGDYAFYWCNSLESVTIPDSVISIGDYAFYNCHSLESVTIPDSVTSIGDYTFIGCISLTEIVVDENNENYCSADGVLFNKNKTELVQYPEKKTNATYAIPDSVTSIGDSAFRSCSSLTSVTIPDSVTSIGSDAFYYCSSLESVNITDVEAWCKISFASSSSNPLCCAKNLYVNNELVTNLAIPDSVTSIGNYAFYWYGRLESVTIPDSVTSIGKAAFYWCNSLTSVKIGDGVTSIGSDAFNGCSSLTSVKIGDGVTSIGGTAFSGCRSLESVEIGDSVTSIGEAAFYGCSSLTSVVIPDSVTSIGNRAFYGCDKLENVYYAGSDAEWEAIKIGSYNECLTSANIICLNGSDIMCEIDIATKTLKITPVGANKEDVVAVVAVKDGVSASYAQTYSGEGDVTFEIVNGFDSMKILVWDSYESMEPLMEYVSIE